VLIPVLGFVGPGPIQMGMGVVIVGNVGMAEEVRDEVKCIAEEEVGAKGTLQVEEEGEYMRLVQPA
jgi:hypothetical protein